MNCPMVTLESADVLLEYCARKLDAENSAILERHIAICPACREFASGQRALWQALDSWEAAPVSPDFDSRLYQRIEKEGSWLDLLTRPFRPMPGRPPWVRQCLPLAAAACVAVMAGALLQPPGVHPEWAHPELLRGEPQAVLQTESAQLESVQPEQVEHALEAMQMLSDFSHQVRAAATESQM